MITIKELTISGVCPLYDLVQSIQRKRMQEMDGRVFFQI